MNLLFCLFLLYFVSVILNIIHLEHLVARIDCNLLNMTHAVIMHKHKDIPEAGYGGVLVTPTEVAVYGTGGGGLCGVEPLENTGGSSPNTTANICTRPSRSEPG